MEVRFVSQDSLWTDAMKDCVQQRIVEPLERHLKHSDFELSVHVNSDRRPSAPGRMEMWVVLQTFDGRGNEIVRHAGTEFRSLTNEISSRMRARLRQPSAPRNWNIWTTIMKSTNSQLYPQFR